MTRIWQWIAAGALAAGLAGCGGGGKLTSPPPPPPPPQAGMLKPVSDPADLETSIKSGFSIVRTSAEVVALNAAADANYTGTYTQEANVDEFDAVRYDGTHLYIAPRRYLHCCFIFAGASQDGAVNSNNPPQRSIRILSTDADNATATATATIPLEDDVSVQGMYVTGDTMFALTARSIYGSYGDTWANVAIWAPEQLGYRVYDVADAAAPQLLVDAKIDGIFVESRRVGDIVYIVSRYAPWIEGLHYAVTSAAEKADNEALLAGVSLDELLPKITINGVTRNLVAPERCYIPNEDGTAGYPVITSVTAVPISDPDAFTTTCYNEEAYGVYVSERALYFTDLRFDSAVTRSRTRIHKFAFAGSGLSYRGSAEIRGHVWRGGQADFRMSEHDGDLRVLASEFDWGNADFVDHYLYVLREAPASPDLEVIGLLPNEARPDEIGKPDEALYGVRFLGDRAFAVTFQQIDPLYVLDLSDPTDPFIAGELEVTGFSDFLHPVNDGLLLGLGTGGEGGVKLELFDVSVLSQPLSRGSVTLGGPGSHSEANWNRHAFAYLASVNGPDRFTIPANIYANDGSNTLERSGLFLFEVHDKATPNLASLRAAGAIVPPDDGSGPWYSSRSRAFIHGNTVYYVRDEQAWAAFWDTPDAINGPF